VTYTSEREGGGVKEGKREIFSSPSPYLVGGEKRGGGGGEGNSGPVPGCWLPAHRRKKEKGKKKRGKVLLPCIEHPLCGEKKGKGGKGKEKKGNTVVFCLRTRRGITGQKEKRKKNRSSNCAPERRCPKREGEKKGGGGGSGVGKEERWERRKKREEKGSRGVQNWQPGLAGKKRKKGRKKGEKRGGGKYPFHMVL